MADPAPVAQTFFVDDNIKQFARLDGILTLVDAKHIEQHLDEEKPEGAENEAVEQVAFADRMLLNKIDLVTEEDLVRVEARLKKINSFAPIQRTEKSKVSVDSVLNIQGFDLKRVLEMDPEFLDTEGEHVHDNTVTSISITEKGDLHLDDIQKWIGGLLKDKGNDIFRMKGVLAIQHSEQKFVYQAVHMIFNGDFNYTEPWRPDEPRESKLVFIGKNLDHEQLRESFRACLATPESFQNKLKNLRFKIGDRVECHMGDDEWIPGEICALMFRDEEDMSPGEVAPYRIHLDDGNFTFAPVDVDHVIRRETGKSKGKQSSHAYRPY
eukprot:gnl/TRDRNA2_/TRDRNA2_191450_c0_seq1.p1 gnl/TRDRNA2_/TRDRNA2_191450_c0~~gnl/TRDRNA2_/TRDRNA2_191450_c0_seq1.p1  ORF type:complete len:324 (+),score=71.33 gnl/TRDRNA2_/TRDRNA2_191450_c0_seq1:398-1369(+)